MNDLSNRFEKIVKVKRACEWDSFDTARLQISVGQDYQDYHEGEELKATVKWAGANFKKVIVCVNDTLQRHNLEFMGLSPEQALEKSEAAGREWIERNWKVLSSLPNVEIIRWNKWDQNYLPMMQSRYNDNPTFKRVIDGEVTHFWNRQKDRFGYADSQFEIFAQHSTQYLIEECAVFAKMFERDQAADIYPGSTLIPCTLLKGMGQYGFTRIEFKPRPPRSNVA
jgi:tRNA-dependent cyclodipeptide synthase